MKKLVFAVVVVGVLCCLALPVTAADWDFYGSARMKTFWESLDASASDTGFDQTNAIWDIQGNSRIGARVEDGNIAGRFEYGTGVNLRLLYATWDFDSGKLLVGQAYTPLDFTISSQVTRSDLTLNGYGTTFSRKPMLQLDMMGFKAALVRPDTDDLGLGSVEVILPSIEAAYTYQADMFSLKAMAGYSFYQVVNDLNEKEGVNRYVLGGAGTFDIGPAYVTGQFHLGQNLGTWNIDADYAGASSASPIVDTNGNVKNNFGYGLAGEAGFIMSESIRFAAGIGFVSYKLDVSGAEDDQAISYYLNSQLNVTPTAFVVPEIGMFDNQEDGEGNPEGSEFYIGAKWQVNF